MVSVAIGEQTGLEVILQYISEIRDLLTADEIDEVQINAGGQRVFTERNGLQQLEPVQLDPDALYAALKRIAIATGQEITDETWNLDCRFVGGRLSAVFPPISPEGISVTIRKFGIVRLTLDDLVERGTLSRNLANALVQEILGRKNILISGATGAGKTVLASALADFIPDNERILLIEQPREIRLDKPNVVAWEALDVGPGGKPVTQRALLKQALRMHPSRIVVGEARGEEALTLLMAMNVGAAGTISTIHANTALDALERLTVLCQMAPDCWPWEVLTLAIGRNVSTVVHLAQRGDGLRYVAEAIRVDSNGKLRCWDQFVS